jgi:hypothetical protein
MTSNLREVLVYSISPSLANKFIEDLEKNPSFSSRNLKFSKNLKPTTKACIYLCNEDMNFSEVLEKCGVKSLPKFIVHVKTPNLPSQKSQNFYKISSKKKITYLTYDTSNPSSIEDILDTASHLVEKDYKLLWFKIGHNFIQIIKWSSFLFSIISALISIVLIFIAGTIAISTTSVERRWFVNSLLTSGNLTFVMSFVGFYGVKKSGIKEYLKIYAGVLIINAIYKIILDIVYSTLDWYPVIYYMVSPVTIAAIISEGLTSFIILLELNIVKTNTKS